VRGGPPLNVWGDDYPTPDGTPIRDYLHIQDLAGAHRLALEATALGDPRTDAMLICNLGSGSGFSVREVIAAAERVIGQPIPRVQQPRRAGDPPELVAAIDRARDVLGWTPERSTLDEMIGSAWALFARA
jgi:UDP-glucose 4-epimerase